MQKFPNPVSNATIPARCCNKFPRNARFLLKDRNDLISPPMICGFLTGVTVVGHEEVPSLSIVAAQLQLQHVRVESHAAPLDVDGRLLLSSTGGVDGGPVHLIQSPLCGSTHPFIA